RRPQRDDRNDGGGAGRKAAQRSARRGRLDEADAVLSRSGTQGAGRGRPETRRRGLWRGKRAGKETGGVWRIAGPFVEGVGRDAQAETICRDFGWSRLSWCSHRTYLLCAGPEGILFLYAGRSGVRR